MTEAQWTSRIPAAPPTLTAAEIARLTGGRLVVDAARPIHGAAVDSRLVQPGQLFVALAGERTDGHRHLAAAAANGAAAVLVRELPADQVLPPDVAVIEVADPLAGLGALAAAWRSRFDPLVVGITGSIAKTSTKDAVAAVLARRFRTLKSEGNQNNEIGLPLTLLRLGPEHEAVALEMGMYVGGEIAQLAAIARPRIGVVTAVHAVHLSRIGTLDAIEAAKGELIEALPSSGMAILNADDERVRRIAARSRASVMTYGFADDADIGAEDVRSAAGEGMRFTLVGPGIRAAAATATLGRHAVHNALAAAAVGVAAGIPTAQIVAGIADGRPPAHRGVLIPAGPITLLDDSYNASPRSMRAALELLSSLPGRPVAVLGEMMELGEGTAAGHREVGAIAADHVQLLIVVGDGARLIADSARAAGLAADRLVVVPDRETAVAALRERLRPGDVVLVKASNGAAFDQLVEALRIEWTPSSAAGDAGDR